MYFCKVTVIFPKAKRNTLKSYFYQRFISFYAICKELQLIKYYIGKFRIYCRGTKILQINIYEIQIQAEFIHVFLLTHICRYLYFITFNLKNRHFCPPKCPRDKKGTKKYVPRVPGAQTRDKIEFLHFTYSNCKTNLFNCYSTRYKVV